MREIHIWISAYKTENGIKVDAHEGIGITYPFGCATCVADEVDIDKFMEMLRELILTGNIKEHPEGP